jgi:hypothetical protein
MLNQFEIIKLDVIDGAGANVPRLIDLEPFCSWLQVFPFEVVFTVTNKAVQTRDIGYVGGAVADPSKRFGANYAKIQRAFWSLDGAANRGAPPTSNRLHFARRVPR